MPRMRLDGARFGSNEQAIAFAMERVADAHTSNGELARITQIADGIHSDGSSHYRDCAFDFGLARIPVMKRQVIVDDVIDALDANGINSDFRVIYGDKKHKTHGHVQWKPVTAMNR